MRLLTSLSLALLLVSLAGDARAVLLRGDVEAVARRGTWLDYLDDGTVPFGLDPDSLEGTRASIRFWLDTGQIPDDGDGNPEQTDYWTLSPTDPEWLAMEIEINGTVRRMPAGQRYLITFEGSYPGWVGDTLSLEARKQEIRPTGETVYPEVLFFSLSVADFGLGGPIPTDLDLTVFNPSPDFTYYESFGYVPFGPAGIPIQSHLFGLEFDLVSVHLHAVPEPSALALLAVAGLPLLRRRRVTR